MTWPLAILAGWAAWRLIDRPLPPRRLIELAGPWLLEKRTGRSAPWHAHHIAERYGLAKQIVPVRNCRNVTKADMIHNAWRPAISVDPETYDVIADGQLLTCEPATVLPMAQRYFLF